MKSKKICVLATAMMLTFVGTTTAMASTLSENTTCEESIVNEENGSTIILQWQENTNYVLGNKVIYEGNLYECIVDHSRLSPLTKYVWKDMGKFEFPQWRENTNYVLGDKVTYKGNVYECIVDHSRLSPLTKYVWKLIIE